MRKPSFIEVFAAMIAFFALCIAFLAWLVPFSPIGKSPFSLDTPTIPSSATGGDKFEIPTATLAEQPSPASDVTQIFPTATSTEIYSCPFSTDNDEVSIKNVIETESIAAVNEDFSILELVYFADAIITDRGQIWHDPIQHYIAVFATYDILNVRNSDIRIEFSSGDYAIVHRTSWSRVIIEATQEITEGIDDSGQIIFRKDTNGCWRISRFDKAPNGYK